MADQNWYPTRLQLRGDSVQPLETKLEVAFRQVLTRHYGLQNSLASLRGSLAQPGAGGGNANGPTTSKLVGLHVLPVDVATLADGVVLTFVKANGDLEFKPTSGGGGGVTSLNSLTGALVIAAGSGISVSAGGSTITISATGGATPNFADDETPSGSLPGTSFTLAHSPSPAASLLFFWNGQLLAPAGVDYTLSGSAITTVQTIGSGDVLRAWYRY